jgi:hypothetical protein
VTGETSLSSMPTAHPVCSAIPLVVLRAGTPDLRADLEAGQPEQGAPQPQRERERHRRGNPCPSSAGPRAHSSGARRGLAAPGLPP